MIKPPSNAKIVAYKQAPQRGACLYVHKPNSVQNGDHSSVIIYLGALLPERSCGTLSTVVESTALHAGKDLAVSPALSPERLIFPINWEDTRTFRIWASLLAPRQVKWPCGPRVRCTLFHQGRALPATLLPTHVSVFRGVFGLSSPRHFCDQMLLQAQKWRGAITNANVLYNITTIWLVFARSTLGTGYLFRSSIGSTTFFPIVIPKVSE